MASIGKYQLKDGTEKYYFQVYAGRDPKTGKRKPIMRRGFDSAEEARQEAVLVEADVIKGTANVVGRQITVGKYLKDWITKYKKNVKEGSMIIYRYNLEHYIIPKIGKFMLTKYTLTEHQAFIDSLIDDGLSVNTVKLINGTVHNAMKKAVSIGYIERNPAAGVEFGTANKQAKKKLHFWTKEQVDAFIDTASKDPEQMWLVFFLMMVDTGMRVGEVLALQWADIDWTKNSVSINKTRLYRAERGENRGNIYLDRPKTNASNRELLLTDRLRNYLKQLYSLEYDQGDVRALPGSTAQNNDFVFRYVHGFKRGEVVKARAATTAFDRITGNASLPHIRIHDLRHTHAVWMREAGLSLDDIKDELGHRDVKTTEIYAEISPAKKKTNHQQFQEFLDQ